MKKRKLLLTISLLISNRPDTIPKCLDSLKVIMDKIPSELILIDTSKNDEIHKLLLTYTDQVYKFEWCKDFAKARNEGIRRANGEWFLYLDDDEWLAEADDILNFFETGEYKNSGYASIQVRNFLNREYTIYSDAWVTRLFHLDGETRFKGKVHEYIYNLHGQHVFLPSMLHHSGYIFETEEKKRQHFERNAKLLLELIEEEPEVLRWQGQMVQEYHTVDDWDTMVNFCQKHIKNVKHINNFMDRNHFCTLYAGLIEGFINLKRYEKVLEVCEQAREDERSTDLLKAFLYLREAEAYVYIEDWNAAIESVECYFRYYEQYKKNKASMREQMGSLLVHRVFEKTFIDTGYNVLIYSELKKGNINALEKCQEEGKINITFSMRFVKFVIELIATMEYRDIFLSFIKAAVQNERLCTMVCALAQDWEEKDDELFRRLACIYAEAESEFWYVCYCRLIIADIQNDKENIERLLKELLCSLSNVFYLPDKVYEIVDKYDIKIAYMWDEIAKEKWQTEILHFVVGCDAKYIDKADVFLRDVYEADDWRVLSLTLAVMEKELRIGPKAEIIDYYKLLKGFGEAKLSMFNENNSGITDMPRDVQAAVKIQEFIDLETQDKISALRKLKDAAEIYPVLADGLGVFLHRYAELENQRVQKQKEEMDILRTQVIAQVRAMIEMEQNEVAMQIIQQLKQMFPKDLEVEQLALEIRLKTLE